MKAVVTLSTLLAFWLSLANLSSVRAAALIEEERVQEYHKRNYTWPPLKEEYHPQTDGWRKLVERRLRQVDALDANENAYNGYMGMVHYGLLCPNFTTNGWGLTKAPAPLVDLLVESLENGLKQKLPEEQVMKESIETPNRPWMITQYDLNDLALRVLQPMAEAWSRKKLVPTHAYGLRVYRNESTLNMHIDKTDTHVISVILHVGHDAESEPWPLVIEDLQGNTNEVSLEAGDMLFYESSKLTHGRPRKFNGSWYSSLFIHYYPTDWNGADLKMQTHYRIPPTWIIAIPSEEKKLLVISTSVKEPDCEDAWCNLKDSIKLSGPAEAYGKVLSTGGEITELVLPSEEELFRRGKFQGDEL